MVALEENIYSAWRQSLSKFFLLFVFWNRSFRSLMMIYNEETFFLDPRMGSESAIYSLRVFYDSLSEVAYITASF